MEANENYTLELIKAIAPYIVAIIGIISGWIIPHLTKNIELEKHRKQFLYEKKYNAYSKYFSIFDEYWYQSKSLLIELEQFNNGIFNTKEDFEEQKKKVIYLFENFQKIRDFLTMPGLEILVFCPKSISEKINSIINLDLEPSLNIDTKASLEDNSKKIQEYIKILREISNMLIADLKLEDN